MNPSQTLYRIQRVDLKLAAQRKRAREIDAELASDEAVQQAEQAQREIEQALRPQEARATNLNLELQTIAAQRSQFSAQLYGGAVSNPKELQDIEHKIEALARRHSELETALLETMIAVEDFQARLKEASAHLAEVQQARASENTALVEERQQIRAEIRQLKAQREKLVTEVARRPGAVRGPVAAQTGPRGRGDGRRSLRALRRQPDGSDGAARPPGPGDRVLLELRANPDHAVRERTP